MFYERNGSKKEKEVKDVKESKPEMENTYVGKMRVRRGKGRMVNLYKRATKKAFVEVRVLFTRNYGGLQGRGLLRVGEDSAGTLT